MYLILADFSEVRERRNHLCHPQHVNSHLLATWPNQLWSWDITKLLGRAKWTFLYLNVLLDVFSHFVVGWLIAQQRSELLGGRTDYRSLHSTKYLLGSTEHPHRPR